MNDDPIGRCLDRALKLLGSRAHFRAELAKKLGARGFEPAAVEAALDRLQQLGHLDDSALAVAEGARLRSRKGLARRGVAAALARKGVGAAAIAAALDPSAADAPEEELAQARRVAARWLAGRRADGAALARALDRKGYPRHVIFRVLKELIPDAEPAADEP